MSTYKYVYNLSTVHLIWKVIGGIVSLLWVFFGILVACSVKNPNCWFLDIWLGVSAKAANCWFLDIWLGVSATEGSKKHLQCLWYFKIKAHFTSDLLLENITLRLYVYFYHCGCIVFRWYVIINLMYFITIFSFSISVSRWEYRNYIFFSCGKVRVEIQYWYIKK